MVILLAWLPFWNIIFPPPPKPVAPDTTTTAESTGVAVVPETLVTPPPAPAMAAIDSTALAQNQPERLIAIDTRNLKVVLSSIGGNVKEVVLKNYLTKDAEQVHMLADYTQPEWARYGALTLGYVDGVAPFNAYSFHVHGDSIILNKLDSTVSVTFTYLSPDGASVAKKYNFHYDGYIFDLDIDIKEPQKLGMEQGITVGWFAPLEPTEADLGQDRAKLGGFFSMGGEFDYFKSVKNGGLKQVATGPIDWVATRTKYFTAVVISDTKPGDEVVVVGEKASRMGAAGTPQPWELFGAGMTYNNPEKEASLSFNIYAGPLDYDRLRDMGQGLSNLVDFGWKLFRPFAVAVLWLFTNMHKGIPNYGVVIIVFSILMKVVFWPLSLKSAKSMYKMKEIQPKLQEIKEKYKNDPAKLNQETMKAYKEFGVNPFGSCLPMLIQMPIFFSLYAVLSNTIELRGAGFMLWITDLSQADPSGKYLFGFGVLPIIMGLAMFFQQKMTITDPKQKMMIYMMPVIFTFIFRNLASGLVLYWAVFSIIGIFEQLMVMRHIKAEKEAKRTP